MFKTTQCHIFCYIKLKMVSGHILVKSTVCLTVKEVCLDMDIKMSTFPNQLLIKMLFLTATTRTKCTV